MRSGSSKEQLYFIFSKENQNKITKLILEVFGKNTEVVFEFDQESQGISLPKS
jgi:hypothetical protein